MVDEQELEYERLQINLDRQAILAFAQHQAQLMGGGVERLAHITAVGELCLKYVKALDPDADPMAQKYFCSVCEAAGFLHETMQQGCDFEALVAVSDEAVAKIVASLTPDVRLPRPRRAALLGNQLGLATLHTQLVKLADMRHECAVRLKQAESDPQAARDWLTEEDAIYGCLTKLHNTNLHLRLVALKREAAKLDAATRSYKRKCP